MRLGADLCVELVHLLGGCQAEIEPTEVVHDLHPVDTLQHVRPSLPEKQRVRTHPVLRKFHDTKAALFKAPQSCFGVGDVQHKRPDTILHPTTDDEGVQRAAGSAWLARARGAASSVGSSRSAGPRGRRHTPSGPCSNAAQSATLDRLHTPEGVGGTQAFRGAELDHHPRIRAADPIEHPFGGSVLHPRGADDDLFHNSSEAI